jgi:excisionase family DNA binding protein
MSEMYVPGTISIEDAARLLGVARSTAYKQARAGYLAGIPVIQVGHRILISRHALNRVLRGQRPTDEVCSTENPQ